VMDIARPEANGALCQLHLPIVLQNSSGFCGRAGLLCFGQAAALCAESI
jgi:hypothetical protein